MDLRKPDDVLAWLGLLGTPLDRHVLTGLLREVSHPHDLLGASDADLTARFGLNRRQVGQLREVPSGDAVARQLDAMERHGIALFPLGHPDYPRNLFEMRVPPPAVFVKGEVRRIDSLAIGIVGPRAPTQYAIEVATSFARDLAPSLTIVSGAALGVDSAVHEAALKAGGRTIAVLGCGIDVNYPAQNHALRRRIAEEGHGALLSTYPPGTPPLRAHFPARNFVLAGLSLAVVVAEASKTSGALVTARAAGEEGRPVYAVPGDVTRRNSAGSNALLRDGAGVATCAEDVLADLENMLRGHAELLAERRHEAPVALHDTPDGIPPTAPLSLSESGVRGPEALVLDLIQHASISHDELHRRLVPEQLSIGDLATTLLMLELKGKIQQLPGRVYSPRL